MIPYRDPRPAYRAHVREWNRKEEARRAADLRPAHEILAEISAKHHQPNHRPADGRTDAQCYEDLKNYIAANPLTAEQRAEDAAQEKERLRAINAPARARRAKARAEAKAWKARAPARAAAADTLKRASRQRRWWAEYARLGHMPRWGP